ncbi:MFS transporter [Thermodesulfobacteriota bacterium]
MADPNFRNNNIIPIAPSETFLFSCSRPVACFNDCCQDLNQFLTPFDILRLKNRLGIPSNVFLERFTTEHIGPKSGLPVITLKADPASQPKCPFVTPAGCSVYEDRPLLMAPLLRWSIETSSWRTTFLVFGAAAGLIIFAISVLLRNHPQDMGLAAYGESTSLPDESSPASSSVATPISSLRSSYQFWALVAIHFFGCVSHALVIAHVVSMATFLGIPGGSAAMTLSIISAVSIGSRFGMSMLADTTGSRNTLSIAMFLQTTPIFILLWAKSLWVFYLFAFLFGIGYGGEMVGFPIFNRQLYGDRAPLGTIYSYQLVGAQLGMAFGGWLGGSLFDLTGGYTWSLIAAISAGYVGMVPILALPYHCRSAQQLPK